MLTDYEVFMLLFDATMWDGNLNGIPLKCYRTKDLC